MIFFIEKNMYNYLINKDLSIETLYNNVTKNINNELSASTIYKLIATNDYICSLIYYSKNIRNQFYIHDNLDEKSKKYIMTDITHYNENNNSNTVCDNVTINDTSNYTTTMLPNGCIVIIFDIGFMDILKNKDSVLSVLKQLIIEKHNFKFKYIDLLQLYLQIKSKLFSSSMFQLRNI